MVSPLFLILQKINTKIKNVLNFYIKFKHLSNIHNFLKLYNTKKERKKMKQKLKILTISGLAFALGFGINNFAISETQNTTTIAVVDVTKLIESSDKVKILKTEQAKNMEDLTKLAQSAKADIEKQSTDENKEKLAKKYQETINQRRHTNAENYAKQLAIIDKDIDNLVKQKAKSSNYNLILAKSSVLYGGDDITEDLAKEINKK